MAEISGGISGGKSGGFGDRESQSFDWDDDEAEGTLHSTAEPLAPTSPPRPASAAWRERLRRLFYQDGHLNRRLLIVFMPVVAFAVIFAAQSATRRTAGAPKASPKDAAKGGHKGGRNNKPTPAAASARVKSNWTPLQSAEGEMEAFPSASPAPASASRLERETPLLRPAAARMSGGAEASAGELATTTTPLPHTYERPPANVHTASPARSGPRSTQPNRQGEGARTRRLRAASGRSSGDAGKEGNRREARAQESPWGDGDTPVKTRLRPGTRVRMRLLEAVRSGATAPVRAQVIDDVHDSQGHLVIAAGCEAEVLIEGEEEGGRLVSPSARVLFVPKLGGEFDAAGGIKGADGIGGIPGSVTASEVARSSAGPGRASRLLRSSGRVFGRVLGATVPGGYEAARIMTDITRDGGGGARPAARREVPTFVTVAAGSEFIFITALFDSESR